jgi:hypothetical protein
VANPFREVISRRGFLAGLAGSAVAGVAPASSRGTPQPPADFPQEAYIVPNFHPASCGWLTTFSKERVYCANNYLDHPAVSEDT